MIMVGFDPCLRWRSGSTMRGERCRDDPHVTMEGHCVLQSLISATTYFDCQCTPRWQRTTHCTHPLMRAVTRGAPADSGFGSLRIGTTPYPPLTDGDQAIRCSAVTLGTGGLFSNVPAADHDLGHPTSSG